MNKTLFLLTAVIATLLTPPHDAIAKGRHRSPQAVRKANAALVANITRQAGETSWQHIVLHHTATTKGSLRGIDRYHRKRFSDPLGIEYHFLIGNGHSAPDGLIELGRWRSRARSLHVVHPSRAPLAVTISLMGNLHERPPSQAQMVAVETLMRRLMNVYKMGPERVSTNTRVDGTFTVCPGRHFPIDNLLWRLQHRSAVQNTDWRRPWPAVPMDGPYPNLDAVAFLLRPRLPCKGRKIHAEPLTSYSVRAPGGAITKAMLVARNTGHGCTRITRRMLVLRTEAGWFTRETNGYRRGRLLVANKGRKIKLKDGRGVMLTCTLDPQRRPVCETTTSGRSRRRH
ncbi:MAG: N-acetylmuramoyl-L-alanine amidase [Myxococcales bacterium]|nr:N-acetylmuramoyl-L-alanine amidase [Myxococcales bacterium]